MTAFYLFNLHFLLVAQAQQLEPHKKNILKVHKKLGNVRDPMAGGDGHLFCLPS